MSNTQAKPRNYNLITPEVIAEFKAMRATMGNGSAVVREVIPEILKPGDRAWRIKKKSEDMENTPAVQFIDDSLQQIGKDAVQRLGHLVNSTNESVATKNVHYTIDHIRGQATKKSVTLTGKINIQNALD